MLAIYLIRASIISALLVFYYKHTKLFIMKNAVHVSRYIKVSKYFPSSDIQGAIELMLIAISHAIFCGLLYCLLSIDLPKPTLNWQSYSSLLIYGIFLGIGCMGTSALICQLLIKLITQFKTNASDLTSLLTMSRGGWIKHHLQSMELFPIYLSLLILTMQVGSEEIIFRMLIYQFFISFGKVAALITATVFFMLMQAFLMHRWQAAIFPMVGATVMGIVHSLLYQQIPVIWPLIIAHVTFFLFAVL